MEFCCNKATTHNLGTILHFFNNPHTNTKGSTDQNNRLVLYKKQCKKKKITIAAAQLPLMNLTWILNFFFFFFRIFTRMQSRANPSRIINRMSVSMVQGSCTHVCDHKKFLQSVSVTITKSLLSVTRGNPCSWGFSFAERMFLGLALFVLILGFFSFFCWCVLQQRG